MTIEDELTQITEFTVPEDNEFHSYTVSVCQINGRNVGVATRCEHGYEAVILPAEYVPQLIQALMKALPQGEKQ